MISQPGCANEVQFISSQNKYRKIITECEARYYTKQIMAGTVYIHSQQVLHRDLKLGNMLLSSNMVVKIGDFGLATSFEDNQPGSLCGTPNYIAPEVLAKKGHSTSSEVWSGFLRLSEELLVL